MLRHAQSRGSSAASISTMSAHATSVSTKGSPARMVEALAHDVNGILRLRQQLRACVTQSVGMELLAFQTCRVAQAR